MKLSRLSAVLALAGLGCTGQINGNSNGGAPVPGQPNNPGPPPQVNVGSCSVATLAKPRAWRLTKAQMINTLMDATGFAPPSLGMVPPETRLEGFANQSDRLSIASLVADYYLKASGEVAGEVVRRSSDFLKCPISGLGSGSCLSDFVKGFGLKIWRRPLLDTEVAKLSALYGTTAGQAGGPEAGLRNVVQGFLMSPNFLYRTEVGTNFDAGAMTVLTDYELASELSYMLWDGPPDAPLLELAAQGKLRDRKVLAGEAMRLLGTANKAPAAMHSFVQQWLQIDDLTTDDKDAMLFPFYSQQVGQDLMGENLLFFKSVMFDQGGDRSFKTLFTANYGFVNARTAPLYGLANVTGNNLVRVDLNTDQRRGILTLASFMAAHADVDDTSPVSRGRYLREEILCDHVPPPDPKDAVFDQSKITPDMTNRERLVAHSVNPACKSCHSLFDGLGFAMENYDAVGRFRTTDKNKMLDPTGSVPLPSGTITFRNFVDLVDQLTKAPELYSCFATQYLSYATGRLPDQINDCEKKLVIDDFVKSGYKIDTLVMSLVNSPSFMARKN
jgi:hypothetical protein